MELRNTNTAVGDYYAISSVNKAVASDINSVYYFKFIVDNDETVTYDGSFSYSNTKYQDRYSDAVNNIEQNVYLNLNDMKRLVRDYPTLTELEVNNIFIQLFSTCMRLMNKKLTSLAGYTLCTMRDGSSPNHATLPDDILTSAYIDVNGNVTGNVRGNVTGNVTGNVFGAVTGNVTGDITGNVTGDVDGNVVGDVTGDVEGTVTGDVTGNVTGNVTGDVVGDVNGGVTGDVTGDVEGNTVGTVQGNVTGDVEGNINGNVTGNVIGDVTGDVTGTVTPPETA